MRPTCANCGDALGSGDLSCPRCREPIEAGLPTPAARAVGSAQTVAVAARTPVDVVPTPLRTREYRPRGVALGQLAAVAIVAGLIVAGGLLALEAFAPHESPPVELVHRSFPALGFSILRPTNWTESAPRGGTAVEFAARAPDTRRFRVVAENATLNHARLVIIADMSHPTGGRNPVALGDPLTVGGKPAVRYTYTQSSSFIQQWWVERPGGTFRIEFVDPRSAEREAKRLAARIVGSFIVG